MRRSILLFFVSFCFCSCFRWNGPIILENNKQEELKIKTRPIIFSGGGGWENSIRYYNKDSIIWRAPTMYKSIEAKILNPNVWGSERDSLYALNQVHGVHYAPYSDFRYDTTVSGVYLMYPNSAFPIGELNTRKKIKLTRGSLQGRFNIKQLIVFTGKDTLIAKGDKEIWDMLIDLDIIKKSFDKDGKVKGKRGWIISVQ
jgi:hypothetical protein